MEPSLNKTDTIIYIPLERNFKKELKSRIYNISTTDAINSMQTRYLNIDESGTVTLLTDMFTNSSFGRKLGGIDGLNWETPTETAYRQSLATNNANSTQNNRNPSSLNNTTVQIDNSWTSCRSFHHWTWKEQEFNEPGQYTNTQGFLQTENAKLNQPYQYNNFANAAYHGYE
jgi:hypothetical protein